MCLFIIVIKIIKITYHIDYIFSIATRSANWKDFIVRHEGDNEDRNSKRNSRSSTLSWGHVSPQLPYFSSQNPVWGNILKLFFKWDFNTLPTFFLHFFCISYMFFKYLFRVAICPDMCGMEVNILKARTGVTMTIPPIRKFWSIYCPVGSTHIYPPIRQLAQTHAPLPNATFSKRRTVRYF